MQRGFLHFIKPSTFSGKIIESFSLIFSFSMMFTVKSLSIKPKIARSISITFSIFIMSFFPYFLESAFIISATVKSALSNSKSLKISYPRPGLIWSITIPFEILLIFNIILPPIILRLMPF